MPNRRRLPAELSPEALQAFLQRAFNGPQRGRRHPRLGPFLESLGGWPCPFLPTYGQLDRLAQHLLQDRTATLHDQYRATYLLAWSYRILYGRDNRVMSGLSRGAIFRTRAPNMEDLPLSPDQYLAALRQDRAPAETPKSLDPSP